MTLIDIYVKVAMEFVVASGLWAVPEDAPPPHIIVADTYPDDYMTYTCTNNTLVVSQEVLDGDNALQMFAVHEMAHWAQCMASYSPGRLVCDLEREAYDMASAYAVARLGITVMWQGIEEVTDCALNTLIYPPWGGYVPR